MQENARKTNRELRKFGLVMAVPLALLAGLTYWKDKPAWPALAVLALFFLLCGLALPRALTPIEWVWMKFAKVLGTVMTYVVLTLAFYMVLTPMGLLMRLIGKRPVELGFDNSIPSYWAPVEKHGVYDRADKPY